MSRRPAPPDRLLERLLPASHEHGPLVAALATTYELNPQFVEGDVLPAIFGLGDWDERDYANRVRLEQELSKLDCFTILSDARRYQGRPRSLRLEVIPRVGAGGQKLHAKVLLLVNERAVRLVVGSANLTEPGYRSNREVALSVLAGPGQPSAVTLVRQCLEDLPRHLVAWRAAGVERVMARAEEVLKRLPAAKDDDASFAWSGAGEPLWKRFVARWPAGEAIKAITVLSPFWSEEVGEDAPLTRLCSSIAQGPGFAKGARIRLLTNAIQVGLDAWRPAMPPVHGFDPAAFGLAATVQAVDPRAQQGALAQDDRRSRALHAKVVLLEGAATALAYAGSANFTRSGWGFTRNGRAPNIEAGVILRDRTTGRLEAALIPEAIGEAIVLGSKGQAPADVEERRPDPPYPVFVSRVELAPMANAIDKVELLIHIDPSLVEGAFAVHTMGHPSVRIGHGEVGVGELVRCPLIEEEWLRRLYRDEQVGISWWACEEPVAVPLNVSDAVRPQLPFLPGAEQPGERQLLDFFQGKIGIEDLVGVPGEGAGGDVDSPVAGPRDHQVDTEAIQAYQVRRFVEALPGLEAELANVSKASGPAMRVALLGAVSPTALGRAIVEAARTQKRNPTAAAFELAELVACLRQARRARVESDVRTAWLRALAEAERHLLGWLKDVAALAPAEVGPGTSFAKYQRTILGGAKAKGVR